MKSNLNMSLCKYPTSMLLIDDNGSFIRQIADFLLQREITAKYFTNPREALNFLNTEYQPDPFTHRCITTDIDRDVDSYNSYFDVRKIHHEIYNPKRFAQISIIGVDYAMPDLNGLDLCRQLKDNFYLKLLLTGEANNTLAVQAFNEEIIDKFLSKGAADLPKLLLQYVHDLQQNYFLKLSEAALYKIMAELYQQAPACLSDKIFVDFFLDLCAKNNIVEYYLLDEHGSFLLLDEKATPAWLMVKSDADMQLLYDHAETEAAPAEVLNILKTRSHVPYFHTDSDWNFSGFTHWLDDHKKPGAYLHAAEKLVGEKQHYYYAHLKNPDAYYLERDRILSYEDYLDTFEV